eukprot:GHVU01136878.1.p1 GENE.GHVU01136878.1~~GHVU01136878.1.p1  ORF type:complete len:288 (-),score=24.57 GHVU01136878.1:311-1174(-)
MCMNQKLFSRVTNIKLFKLIAMGVPFESAGPEANRTRYQDGTGAIHSPPMSPPSPVRRNGMGLAAAMNGAGARLRAIEAVRAPQYGAERRRQLTQTLRCYTAIDRVYALEDPVLTSQQRQQQHIEHELFQVRAYGTALMQLWLRLREVSLGQLDIGDWTLRSYTVVAEAQELNEEDGAALARSMRILAQGIGSVQGGRGQVVWRLLCRNLGQPERVAGQLPRISYREDLWQLSAQTRGVRDREPGPQDCPRNMEELENWARVDAWLHEEVPDNGAQGGAMLMLDSVD